MLAAGSKGLMLGVLCAVLRHRARWLTRDDVANDDAR